MKWSPTLIAVAISLVCSLSVEAAADTPASSEGRPRLPREPEKEGSWRQYLQRRLWGQPSQQPQQQQNLRHGQPDMVKLADKLLEGDPVKHAFKHLEDVMKDLGGKADDVTEPLMEKIDAMRAKMCGRRPNLVDHEPCLTFLTELCTKDTETAPCQKFMKYLESQCGSQEDPAKKEKTCNILEQVFGVVLDAEPEEEEPEPAPAPAPAAPAPAPQAAQVNATEDSDGDGVPDAKDAFPHDPNEFEDTDGDGIGDTADADVDGDGVNNKEDPFPKNASEWADTDGDGIGDNSDPDIDGDGVPNKEDAFPKNANESKDTDGDGVGDNEDPDIDGDGVPNKEDAFPTNANESKDTDGDGVGDNEDPDIDGDGVPNKEDAFPTNAAESKDTDGDGVGDNEDPDIDGDGVPNEKDAFPHNAAESTDMDGDGIGDNEDPDIDGDGIPNEEDGFPKNAKEWADSDGDGIGDNEDAHPHDPCCKSVTEPCTPCPTGEIKDFVFNKTAQPLPPQGYSDYDRGPHVMHGNTTYTGDWRKEWPQHDETEEETILRICSKHPETMFCLKYKAKHGSTWSFS